MYVYLRRRHAAHGFKVAVMAVLVRWGWHERSITVKQVTQLAVEGLHHGIIVDYVVIQRFSFYFNRLQPVGKYFLHSVQHGPYRSGEVTVAGVHVAVQE